VARVFADLAVDPFKVIAAEGEQKASRALREASEVIGNSPAALQLRYLQVIYLLYCDDKKSR